MPATARRLQLVVASPAPTPRPSLAAGEVQRYNWAANELAALAKQRQQAPPK